jgi:prolyl-tRNA synthetase
VGRTLAAAIEQNHDEQGIIWPIPLAPFEVTILPLQIHDPAVMETALRIYAELLGRGIDVLLDDRDERAGVKFNDADLIGIPLRVTVGKKGIQKGEIEMKRRAESQVSGIAVGQAPDVIRETVQTLYDSIK